MSYKPWKLWRVRALSKLRTLYGSGQLTLGACYFKYDTDFPYVPQVEAHIELAKKMLPNVFPLPPQMRLFD